MIWILLLTFQVDLTAELQAEANQAFAQHVAAENEKSVQLLELQVKATKSTKEKTALKRTIRNAKLGKELIPLKKGSFEKFVMWDSRQIGTRPGPLLSKSGTERLEEAELIYAPSVSWEKIESGDLLHLDFSHSTGHGGGPATATMENMRVLEADENSVTAQPVSFKFGTKLTEIVPVVKSEWTIRLVDSGKLPVREGSIFVDGFWYVATVENHRATIVKVDQVEVEEVAKQMIAAKSKPPVAN